MGIRFSSSTTPCAAAAAPSTTAAKVITVSGLLREYAAAPIPASIILADCSSYTPDQSPPASPCLPFFLCNADALSFDEPVPALAPGDQVLPGRLYFVLPDAMRRRPLSGAEMGALAVRASRALEAAAGRGGGGRGGRRKGRALKISPVVGDVMTRKEGSFDDGCGAQRQQDTALVAAGSSVARQAPAQLKRSAMAWAGGGQRRRAAGRFSGSVRARRGGSFRGRLGTIQEDVE